MFVFVLLLLLLSFVLCGSLHRRRSIVDIALLSSLLLMFVLFHLLLLFCPYFGCRCCSVQAILCFSVPLFVFRAVVVFGSWLDIIFVLRRWVRWSLEVPILENLLLCLLGRVCVCVCVCVCVSVCLCVCARLFNLFLCCFGQVRQGEGQNP